MDEAEKNYEAYVERYSKCYEVAPEVAKTHKTVQLVKEYYEDEVGKEDPYGRNR